MKEYISKQIQDSINLKQKMFDDEKIMGQINSIIEKCIECYQNDCKTMICGNGGSAADAQHIAAEFVSRFYFDRPPLPSIAITTDTSILTAIGNDYGYDKLFVRQVEAHSKPGDILFLISTSGTSPNIIAAAEYAKKNNLFTFGLTGNDGGKMKDLCDICITIPSNDTPRIQECHLLIGHIICGGVEETIFQSYKK